MNDSTPRIDKYLWSTRIFKTRADATDACKSGKVSINSQPVKASREVKTGDVIAVRKGPVSHSYKVLALLTQRVSVKNLAPYILDITPPEELAKGERHNESAAAWRERGAGRPTKKERRELERVLGERSLGER
ncbi:MAG: S4 domain-containing protein [Bacteroidales bacterium]|nr:S4 domain-containing protein [Bacteroidales bacterium]